MVHESHTTAGLAKRILLLSEQGGYTRAIYHTVVHVWVSIFVSVLSGAIRISRGFHVYNLAVGSRGVFSLDACDLVACSSSIYTLRMGVESGGLVDSWTSVSCACRL